MDLIPFNGAEKIRHGCGSGFSMHGFYFVAYRIMIDGE